MNNHRYFIVDYGKDGSDELIKLAEQTVNTLKATKDFHVITYLTDLPNSLMVTETTEDDFLLHFTDALNSQN